jgi:sulfate adenylyltransferase subunit 2
MHEQLSDPDRLEAESIHVLREAAAGFRNPVMLPVLRTVRFRTLGCYPLTGGIESSADTIEEIIGEKPVTTSSGRQGRLIDQDASASMEGKKQEGHF